MNSNSNQTIKIPNYTDIIFSRLQQIESHKTVVDFEGNFVTETLFFLYLVKKYSNDNTCYILNREELIRPQNGKFVWGLELILRENDEKTQAFEKKYRQTCKILAARFVNCIKRTCEFILIPVGIYFLEDGEEALAHENVMIYKFALNKIEHIEPHGQFFNGKDGSDHKRIQFLIKIFIDEVNEAIGREENMEKVEFVDTEATCPTGFISKALGPTGFISKALIGFQGLEGNSKLERFSNVEPRGYCVAWSLFLFEMGMLNPTMSSRQINDSITEYIRTTQSPAENHNNSVNIVCDYLLLLIRGYANIVFQKIDKYFSSAFNIRINRTTVIKKNNEIREKILNMMEMETHIEDNKGNYDVQSERLDAKDWIDKSNAFLKENPHNTYYKLKLKASTKKLHLLDNHLKLESEIKNSPNVRKLHMKVLPPFQVSIGTRHGQSSRSSSSSSSRSSSSRSSRSSVTLSKLLDDFFGSSSSSSDASRSPIVWHGYTDLEKTRQAAMKQLDKVTQDAMKQASPPEVIDLSNSSWVVDIPSSRSSHGSKRRSSRKSKKKSSSHKNIIDISSSHRRSGGRNRRSLKRKSIS